MSLFDLKKALKRATHMDRKPTDEEMRDIVQTALREGSTNAVFRELLTEPKQRQAIKTLLYIP